MENDADDATTEHEATNMIIGSSGLVIETVDTKTYIVYNPRKRMIEIRSIHRENAPQQTKAALHVEGNIHIGELDVLDTIEKLRNEVTQLQKRCDELERITQEMYFAPGMPGSIIAAIDFNDRVETECEDKKNAHDALDDCRGDAKCKIQQ